MLNIPEMAQNRVIKKIWLEETGMDTCQPEGFTLIELLVVIAIISILAVIGFGAFGYDVTSNADEAVTNISMDMQLARAEAISQNTQYKVVFMYPSVNQYQVQGPNGVKTVPLPQGIIFGAGNAIGVPNDQTTPNSSGVDFTSGSVANTVTFSATGGASPAGAVYVVVGQDVGSGNVNRVRAVQMQYTATGMVQSWLWSGTAWQSY